MSYLNNLNKRQVLLKLFNKTQGKDGMVGLYATPDNLTLAHVAYVNDVPELIHCEVIPASGSEECAGALGEKVRELNLEGTNTCFVVSPEDYKLLLVEAPNVAEDEMAGAIKWKIKDLVGHPIEEMAITVFDVPERAYRSQANMVYAVAARKNRIQDIAGLVHVADLELDAIDIPELAMMNLSKNCADDTEGLAFLDLRPDGSTLNLSRGGEIFLTRRLNTRVSKDILESAEWTMIRERLVTEIQRSLDYYQSQMGQALVPKIILAPREEGAEKLVRELNESMTIEVGSMDLNGCLKSHTELPDWQQQDCMLAIGGAMRQETLA